MDFNERYRRAKDVFGSEPEPVLLQHADALDRSTPVLDIGAGQGRHALYLARRGFDVHAIDPSAVGIGAIDEAARREQLSIRTECCGFESIEAEAQYGSVLLQGIFPVLPRPHIERLVERAGRWTIDGGLVLITAFTSDDDSLPRFRGECRQIGENSFADADGAVRTFFAPGRMLSLFDGWDALYYREYEGAEHRHGDGPPHRHAIADAVLRRRPRS